MPAIVPSVPKPITFQPGQTFSTACGATESTNSRARTVRSRIAGVDLARNSSRVTWAGMARPILRRRARRDLGDREAGQEPGDREVEEAQERVLAGELVPDRFGRQDEHAARERAEGDQERAAEKREPARLEHQKGEQERREELDEELLADAR